MESWLVVPEGVFVPTQTADSVVCCPCTKTLGDLQAEDGRSICKLCFFIKEIVKCSRFLHPDDLDLCNAQAPLEQVYVNLRRAAFRESQRQRELSLPMESEDSAARDMHS